MVCCTPIGVRPSTYDSRAPSFGERGGPAVQLRAGRVNEGGKMLRRKALAVAATGLSVLVACGSSAAATTRATAHAASSNGTLTVGDIQPVASWSTADSSWANASPYYQAVYDTLLHATPAGVIEPWLATSYTWNKAHTVMTLKLQKGVKFTDGTKFDAKVAAENLLAFKKGSSPNASDLSFMTAAKATGRYTLKIYLAAPDPALPTYLTQNPGLMESAKGLTSKNANTVPDGSGPYIYQAKSSVPGSTWVFTKNKNYWAPSQQHYAKLVIKYYSTSQSLLDAMQGHQINAANTTLTTSDSGQIRSAGFKIVPYYLNWEGLILFDRSGAITPALGNVKVRQAINYAINKSALLQAAQDGAGQLTTQVFAPSSPAYSKSLDNAYPYNPAKAKALLAQAGYANGFSFTLPTIPVFPTSAYTLVQQNLAAVGITANLSAASLATYINDELTPQWSAPAMALQEDPTPFMVDQFELAPNAAWNPQHTSSPTLSTYLHEVEYAKTTAAGDKASKQVDAYVVNNAWFDPWYRPEAIMVTDSHTKIVAQADNCDPYLWNITPTA